MRIMQFIWEVYLTGFVILFRLSRAKDIAYKAGGAVGAITMIEWLILIGISGYIEMFLREQFVLSKPLVVIALFALFLFNGYFLFFRRYGLKFAQEFDSLVKTRKTTLVVSCMAAAVAAIVFFVFSAIAHQRFIRAH